MDMKTIGYVRVSTDEQAREGISLEAQKAKITAYCELNDLELIGIIEDAGKSGKDLNREGIQSLLENIRGRQIEAVVVYKLDRLSRRVKDTLTLMDLIEKRSVAFHSITEKIDKGERAGQIPFGWTLDTDGKALLPNAREQKAISLIRDLNGKGYSYRAICRELEKEGHKPTGKIWHAKTIGSILKRAA
jgi:site-specific DNA recombinase